MIIEVQLPSLGDEDDAVQGGRVSALLAEPGDMLEVDGDLLEIITDKAAFVVPSPAQGTLVEWHVAEGEQVKVGQALCLVETNREG
ncbi:MAG: Pyruvate dehydrogenase, dihydrolipoyltransacetylase component [Candidatus Hydrogenedentota bacterium]|jgi:2-oxoisovalerate dehydrogenase E2 component (dihydrolipoyl transacylase)